MGPRKRWFQIWRQNWEKRVSIKSIFLIAQKSFLIKLFIGVLFSILFLDVESALSSTFLVHKMTYLKKKVSFLSCEKYLVLYTPYGTYLYGFVSVRWWGGDVNFFLKCHSLCPICLSFFPVYFCAHIYVVLLNLSMVMAQPNQISICNFKDTIAWDFCIFCISWNLSGDLTPQFSPFRFRGDYRRQRKFGALILDAKDNLAPWF